MMPSIVPNSIGVRVDALVAKPEGGGVALPVLGVGWNRRHSTPSNQIPGHARSGQTSTQQYFGRRPPTHAAASRVMRRGSAAFSYAAAAWL